MNALADFHDPRLKSKRGTALVIDDKASNRMLLKTLLIKEGFQVIAAENGEQGVEKFEQEGADIVFMDVMMPVLDGYEATRRIKALAGDEFVPVIFVTVLTDKSALAQCIEAGGDDVLGKPLEPTVLRAKTLAAERTRDLYRRIQEQNRELNTLHSQLQREQEIAERIFTAAVTEPNVALESIRTLLRPATTFNGDLLLTAQRPSGELNILLGDFTGHGLAAAVGALPVSEAFRAMTEKGFAATDIIKELNDKLVTLLPTGMFMAACFLTVDTVHRSVAVWNGGMPEVLVLDQLGTIRDCLGSSHHPLGITKKIGPALRLERMEVESGDHILLLSDGVLDARNPAGDMFGKHRLEREVQEAGSGKAVFAALAQALEDFCRGRAQDDDITLVDIPCRPELTARLRNDVLQGPQPRAQGVAGSWRWALELHGPWLQAVDPVPFAIAQLREFLDLNEHREAIYTVMVELFSNALDHGVLKLDSALKSSPEGFAHYYAEREKRLMALREGRVRIELTHLPLDPGGRLTIRLEDSGEGFDYDAVCRNSISNLADNSGFAGRGIPLLKSLCQSLRYEASGNSVEAVYAW